MMGQAIQENGVSMSGCAYGYDEMTRPTYNEAFICDVVCFANQSKRRARKSPCLARASCVMPYIA